MISASLQQRKTRTRRSMLFVHGANAAMVSNSFIYPADALMFDLEDSVALREKTPPAAWFTTRCNIRCIAILKPLCVSTRWIRMGCQRHGSRRSRWCGRCASAENRYRSGCSGYRKEILRIEKACGREPGSTGLLAAIESPLGITRAVEIAHASERLIGIALGAEDYVRNLRTERSPEGTELLFARCSICRPRALRVFRRSIPSIPTLTTKPDSCKKPPTSNSWALTANR